MYASKAPKSALPSQAGDPDFASIEPDHSDEGVLRSVTLPSFPTLLSGAPGSTIADQETGERAALAPAVTAVNNAPVWSGLVPADMVENGPPVATFASACISDVDLDVLNGGLGNYQGAWLYFDSNEYFVHSFVAGSSFTIEKSPFEDIHFLKHDGLVFARYQIGYDSDPSRYAQSIDFTSEGTIATSALVNDVIRSVHLEYRYDAPDPATGDTIVFGDAAGFDRNIAPSAKTRSAPLSVSC